MSKKVLIADDEAHIRLLLEQTLDPLLDVEVEILTADNGGDALATIRGERPDLVLLDVMMLTAKGQELDRVTGAEVGADLYMTKPFDPDDVLARALEVLGIELE